MKNAWLSMTIPDACRESLFALTTFLESKFAENGQKFDKMLKNDLHMTSVFLGKQYRSKDLDKVMEIISRFNFRGTMKIKSISLFPPTKNNLIVLKYDIDKSFHSELKKLKEALKSELSYEIDIDEYVPHVTLGKLALTKDQIKELVSSKQLETFYNEYLQSDNEELNLQFIIDDQEPMYMCGSDH